jgi:chromosome segregation ATPase
MDNAHGTSTEYFSEQAPTIERPIGAVAEAIHQRILAEQKKLHAEENSERDLTTKRIALLTDGTDKDVDTCEAAIDQSRTSQLRCLERIELLAEQLKQANRKAESQRLDEIAAGAQRARDRGLVLLRKYPKLARELATLLAEVKTCEDQITAANVELDAAKRPNVESADPRRFPIHGAYGLVMDTVGLHQAVNLPNESDGAPYWLANDADQLQASVVRNAIGIPTSARATDTKVIGTEGGE